MSYDHLSNQLLSNNEIELDSGKMSILRARPRYLKFQRFFLQRNILVLSIVSVITMITFFLAFYSSIDYVVDLFSPASLSNEHLSEQYLKTMMSKQGFLTPRKGLTLADQNIKYHDFNYLNSDSLTYENRTYADELQLLYRFPKTRSITSLLLIFHGCGRSARDWFHTIERQRIIGAAIDLGYACVAFQATDQVSRCWSSTSDLNSNEDVQMVYNGLENFYKEYPKLKSLSRYTFGASSGGIFSSIFAINPRYTIQGQIIFISIILPEILETHVKENSYPPTAWIYMLRDIEFASWHRINSSIQIFAREHIPHIAYDIEPIRVFLRTFQNRIPTITQETSNYIFYRLQQRHWLDAQNYLIHNPRRDDDWQRFVFANNNESRSTSSIYNNLRKHETILPDFMNTIYGEHEISFERSFEALSWLQNLPHNQTISTL